MAQPLFVLLVEIDLGAVTTSGLKIAVTVPAATKGVAYVGQLAASGGTAPYTYAISAGSLPTGLSLNTSTGAITGTPSATGYFEFTAAVTDFAFATASKVVAVTVSSGIAVSGGLALAEVGQAYSSGLSAVGGTPPYTWSIASGSLPTSLSINGSTGIISGTPTVANTFNFTVRATDSGGDAQDFPTSISVAAAISLSGAYPSGVVGIAYSNALVTSGGVGPFTYSISSGAIDPGLALSSTSGIISGTPTAASTYTFDVTVIDSLGGSDTSSQSVSFYSSGSPPSQTSTIIIDLSSDTQSTKYGSITKLTVGRKFFDPSASQWGLSATSLATFYSLMEITNSSNTACCELYRETGSGSPVVVGTPSTTNSLTSLLVSADVTSSFISTANSGIFAARIWAGVNNGIDEATCSSSWIEIIP